MKLKDQLYNIVSQKTVDDKTIVSIKLNPECFIYKAHFPGNPITPGVCIVQTASELLEVITNKTLEISGAKDIKFVNILSPVKNPDVDFVFSAIESNEDCVKAQVNVVKGDEVFATIAFTLSIK